MSEREESEAAGRSSAPGRPDAPSGGSAPAAADRLALELRVAELERDLALARDAVAGRTALLDALHHHRTWRAFRRADLVRRAGEADILAAGGHTGLSPDGVRLPFAGLPPVSGDVPESWTNAVTVAGVTLPAVAADAPATFRRHLTDVPAARVRAFAALRPAAWLQNRGGARFTVALAAADGTVLAETSRDVDPSARRADRRWRPLELTLPPVPAGELATLELRTSLPPDVRPDFCWALWGDPVLLVDVPGSAAPAGPRRPPRTAVLRALVPRRATPDAAAVDPVPPTAPTLSFLLPVHDPPPDLLRATLASVLAQDDGAWQLCVTDDGSTDPVVRALLAEHAAADARITVARHEKAGGISAATNRALTDARGAYVATLDHDDLLVPDAVRRVRAALAVDPTADVLYSDNDKVAGTTRFAPALKPGWSPERLRACMYTLHLGVYRRALVETVGGWRPAFDGAQDHDLVLRLTERTNRVVHLPQTLYSWRAHAGSAALTDEAKPLAADRGLAAVAEHLTRIGLSARVEPLPYAGRYRVVHEAVDAAEVAAVVALTGTPAGVDAEHLDAVVAALTARGVAVVVAVPPALATTVRPALGPGATLVEVPGATAATPWGALARAGVAATNAPTVVLLEELAVPAPADGDDWLAELVGPLRIPAAVASAPMTVGADGRVVQAGVTFRGGVPLPVHAGADPGAADPPPDVTMVTDRAAAGGVVAVRRTDLDAVPLDGILDRTALVDLTARLTRDGGRVVCSPHAPWRVAGLARATVADVEELRRLAHSHRSRVDPFASPRTWADSGAQLVPRDLQLTGVLAETIAVLGGVDAD